MNPSVAEMISVVIPTCGISDFLWETLESVNRAREKCAPGEVVVCINAGPGSVGIARIIQERVGDWVKIEYSNLKEQIPLYPNWNLCVSKATRPYVHLLHDDDKVSPYFYDAISDLMGGNPRGSIYSTAAIVFGGSMNYSSGAKEEGRWAEAVKELKKGNQFVNPCVVFNKELFAGFDERWKFVADWNAWHQLAQSGDVFCTRQPLAYYRIHEGAATARIEVSGENVRECRKLLAELQKDDADIDYGFAAKMGYLAATKAARRGDFTVALKQIRLAAENQVSLLKILKILYALLKSGVRRLVASS